MAGEWVKVRSSLRNDPRVGAIADFLSTRRRFLNWLSDHAQHTINDCAYEYVTRDVTRRICVTGLVDVWCLANEIGKADGDDCVMRHCSFDALDHAAGIPEFGLAMGAVEWAIEERKGGRVCAVRLPDFKHHNTLAGERSQTPAARRQAAYRERKKAEAAGNADATPLRNDDASRLDNGDVTRNGREEKRREHNNSGAKAPSWGARRRCPPDFEPDADHRAIAAQRGIDIAAEAALFRDHEFASPRSDWPATFRNWLRRAKPAPRPTPAPPPGGTLSPIRAAAQRIARGSPDHDPRPEPPPADVVDVPARFV